MFTPNCNRLLALEEELFKQSKAVKHRKNNKSQKNIKTQTYLSDSNRLLALEEELISQRRNSKHEYQIKENKKYQRMAKMLNYENSANNKILALQQSLSKETVNKQKHKKRDRTKSKTQKTQAMTFDYNEAIELQYQGNSFAAALDYTTTEQFDLDDDISTIEVESFEVKEDNQTSEAVIPEVLPPESEEDTESEQATEAEAFEADIQAILSGAKAYEPKQQKTSDNSSLIQPKNNTAPQENTPTKQTPSPQPQTENPHAIFDKIAQNMAYANSFDLGTISLEQRFDEFDDLLDAQESKALTVKSSPAIEENDLIELNYADFEHDLALMSEGGNLISKSIEQQELFISKPEEFLTKNPVELRGLNKTDFPYSKGEEIVFNIEESDNSIYFQQKTHPILDIYLKKAKPDQPGFPDIFQISLTKSFTNQDQGVRLLPWKDNKVTYCKLDNNAEWFFTGPLTGCHIYVGHIGNDNDTPYVFHVNDNTTGNDIKSNIKAKDEKIKLLITSKLSNLTITHRLIRTDYASEDKKTPYNAFVYGKKINKEWKFYVHSFEYDTNNMEYKIKLAAKEIEKSNYQNLK